MRWLFSGIFALLALLGVNILVEAILNSSLSTTFIIDTASTAGFTLYCTLWAFMLVTIAKNGWLWLDYLNFTADWVPSTYQKVLYLFLGLLILSRLANLLLNLFSIIS